MAIMVSIFSIAMYLTALAFYIFFNERLYFKHHLGMAVLLLSVFLIGMRPEKVQQKGKKISILWPLLASGVMCFVQTIIGLTARIVLSKTKLKSMQLAIDSFFLVGLFMACMFVYQHNYVREY